MKEKFSKPGVGGIVERKVNHEDCILIQERDKLDAPLEKGLIEIPAGKIREYENIFDCLRREIKEETGLTVTEIIGENDSSIYEANGYKVLHYSPFSCAQNTEGYYPILVQIFICRAAGDVLTQTNETKNLRWVPLNELREMLINHTDLFYPMHVETLRKYLKMRNCNRNAGKQIE